MNEETRPQNPSLLEKLEQWVKIISSVAIPVILAVGGWIIQRSISDQSVNKDYVQLAVSILTKSDEEVATPLREWAVELLNDKSSVKFDNEVKRDLSAGKIALPGRAPTPGGGTYDVAFVDELFSEWNPDTDLSLDKKVILAFFAETFLEKRWLEVTRFFEPDYAKIQLEGFLRGGIDGKGGARATRQFIWEALELVDDPDQSLGAIHLGDAIPVDIYDDTSPVEGGKEFDLNRVTKIKFLDINSSSHSGEGFGSIKLRLIQDDGTILDTGIIFRTETFFFRGSVG